MACVWEGFYHWDVRGADRKSTCVHVNRAEGGVHRQAKPASTQVYHSFVIARTSAYEGRLTGCRLSSKSSSQ